MSPQPIRCECGAATGVACGETVSASDAVIVEHMPHCWRDLHVKARNRGRYPHNGAERLRCTPGHAEQLVEDDPEWSEIVRPLGRPPLPPGEAHRPRRTIRISDALWARIQAAAERAGLTVGEWIRRACEERATRETDAKKPPPRP